MGWMDPSLARQRVHEASVGRLATITSSGRPHLVPCCFALCDDTAYTAVDAKPKSTLALRRVDNLVGNPAVSLLVDHYEEDWSALWWVRLDGTGRVVESPTESEAAKRALIGKYPQYRTVAIPGPMIALEIETWRAWP
jgi:PPOX class probable F420-dependent enzyme